MILILVVLLFQQPIFDNYLINTGESLDLKGYWKC